MHRQNVQKMILKRDYCLLLLKLLKIFKKCQHGDWLFYWNFLLKVSKLKDSEKDWKQSEKIILITIKKSNVFFVKLVHFIQCRAYFELFMHTLVACMKVFFPKIVKNIPISCMFFYIFALFQPYFTLFRKKSSSWLHAL